MCMYRYAQIYEYSKQFETSNLMAFQSECHQSRQHILMKCD